MEFTKGMVHMNLLRYNAKTIFFLSHFIFVLSCYALRLWDDISIPLTLSFQVGSIVSSIFYVEKQNP